MHAKNSRLTFEWPLVLLFLMLAACATLQSERSIGMLHSHWGNDLTEGEQAFASLRFAHGGPIYVRPDRPPYTILLYGPLFYIALGTIDVLAKPSSFGTFMFEGRIFVFVCYLLIAFLAWRAARNFCSRSWFSLFTPLFILTNVTFYLFDASLRPDIPALLCSLFGFFLLLGESEPTWSHTVVAGTLMGVGFLFKQSFLAAPAAAFLWLLWKRRFRFAAGLTAAALLPVVSVIGGLELHGDPVLYSLLLPRYTLYDIPGELRILKTVILGGPTTALCVVLAFVALWKLLRTGGERVRPLALYLGIASIIGLVTMAQVGAERYYLAEATTLCAILAPAGLELWAERLAVAAPEMRLAAALLLIVVPSTNLAVLGSGPRRPHYRQLVSLLAGHRLLSSVPYVAAQGRNPEMVNPWTNSLLERLGRWSPAPILRQVRAEEFDYIVLATMPAGPGQKISYLSWRGIPTLSPSIMKQVERSYRFAGTCKRGTVVVFVPRQSPRGAELAGRLASTCGWPGSNSNAQDQSRATHAPRRPGGSF